MNHKITVNSGLRRYTDAIRERATMNREDELSAELAMSDARADRVDAQIDRAVCILNICVCVIALVAVSIVAYSIMHNRTERPSPAASAAIERVNQEPLVKACHAVTNAIFGQDDEERVKTCN